MLEQFDRYIKVEQFTDGENRHESFQTVGAYMAGAGAWCGGLPCALHRQTGCVFKLPVSTPQKDTHHQPDRATVQRIPTAFNPLFSPSEVCANTRREV